MRSIPLPAPLPTLLLVLLPILLLSACAPRRPVAVPPVAAGGVTPIAYPPETRTRMMSILESEWREWGARVIDARDKPVDDGDEGPVAEEDPAAFSKVLAYWTAVEEYGFIDRNKRAFIAGSAQGMCTRDELSADGRDAIWGCEPWSAAFISYVMKSTGIDRAEFPPAIGHHTYVDALIDHTLRYGPQATFYAREVDAYAPQVGDLMCADRSGRRGISTLADREAELGSGRAMHCDIVDRVLPGEVIGIGGNVAQGVTAVRYRTDESGHLLRNTRRWFVVFQNRIGLSPGS